MKGWVKVEMNTQTQNLEWEKNYPEKGSLIWFGKCGHVRLFGIAFILENKKQKNRDETKYELKCYLPGVPKDLGYSEGSIDELKKLAESRFETWLNATGLTKR